MMGFAARCFWLVALVLGLHSSICGAVGDSTLLASFAETGTAAPPKGRKRASRRSGTDSVVSDLSTTTDTSTGTDSEESSPESSQKKKKRKIKLPLSRKINRRKSKPASDEGAVSDVEGTTNSSAEAAGSIKAARKKGGKALGSVFKRKRSKGVAASSIEDESTDAEAALDAAAAGDQASVSQQAPAATGKKRRRPSLFKKRKGNKAGEARDGPHPRRGMGRLRSFKQSESSSASPIQAKGVPKSSAKPKNTRLLIEPKLTADSSLSPEDGFPRVLPRHPQKDGTTPRNPFTGCMPVQATPGFEAFASGLPSQGAGCRLRMQAGHHLQRPLRQEQQQARVLGQQTQQQEVQDYQQQQQEVQDYKQQQQEGEQLPQHEQQQPQQEPQERQVNQEQQQRGQQMEQTEPQHQPQEQHEPREQQYQPHEQQHQLHEQQQQPHEQQQQGEQQQHQQREKHQ